jgi:hypothetical protein
MLFAIVNFFGGYMAAKTVGEYLRDCKDFCGCHDCLSKLWEAAQREVAPPASANSATDAIAALEVRVAALERLCAASRLSLDIPLGGAAPLLHKLCVIRLLISGLQSGGNYDQNRMGNRDLESHSGMYQDQCRMPKLLC